MDLQDSMVAEATEADDEDAPVDLGLAKKKKKKKKVESSAQMPSKLPSLLFFVPLCDLFSCLL